MLILTVSYFYKSYALYEEKKDFDAINGTVEEAGDIYFAYYVDGTISRSMPLQNTGYTLDKEKSSCTNGVSINWNNSTWQGITDYTNYNTTTNTRTKCTLYFNKTAKTVKTALGNIEVNTYTPDFTKSACDDTSCESHEKGIFETTDYDGNPTYYYRGSVENNYVKFAGYYWRIIRINSNGSIRMIYDGTSAHDNGEAAEDRMYGKSEFNDSNNDNIYVGYEYQNSVAHGYGTPSIIKQNITKFYSDKLASYNSFLDTKVGFCNDRTTLNEDNNVGTGTVITYYSGYLRLASSKPDLGCNNSDHFVDIGQGLITADEIMLSGFSGGFLSGNYNFSKTSTNSYLCIGYAFWTMTPLGYYSPFKAGNNKGALLYFVSKIGGEHYANMLFGLRPVINIRSDVTITGSGTKNDPYLVN